MKCRCGNEMQDIGTGAGGIFIRWCSHCGRLFSRSMNPRLPGERWEEPKATFKALMDFTSTIEVTGGLTEDPEGSGNFVPVADDTWVDLGESYLLACTALSRKPKIEKVEHIPENE